MFGAVGLVGRIAHLARRGTPPGCSPAARIGPDGRYSGLYVVGALRRLAFGQSVARLQQASSAAVSTLLKVMVDPASPPSTKVRAADSVLDHAAKAIEIEDIEARLTEFERAAEATKGHRR